MIISGLEFKNELVFERFCIKPLHENQVKLLLDFVEQLPEKNISIEKFLKENDMVGISRLAHNIKGVSSNLGALQLSEYAGKLEKFASDGYTTELLVNTAREVRDISEKFIEDASKFLASTKEK